MNSKNKGNTYERKMANLLSDRFKLLLNEDKGFRRNPDSGSYFGGSNKRKLETHNLDYAVFGDIIVPKLFKFAIECKHYKTAPTFKSIVCQKVTQWDEWIDQAVQDAISAQKEPMIIIKYNNVPDMVFLKHVLDQNKIILTYNNFNLYTLDWVLSQPDDYFFDQPSTHVMLIE
jgi:hypothetical protein